MWNIVSFMKKFQLRNGNKENLKIFEQKIINILYPDFVMKENNHTTSNVFVI